MWALHIKAIPFTWQFIKPRSTEPDGAQNESYLKIHPFGQIPALQDDGFVVYEAAAILCYLADKYHWHDLYPVDLQARAKVNQYLHWHHSNTRQLTQLLIFPALKFAPYDPKQTELKVPQVMGRLEHLLSDSTFLCGPRLTLADIMAYGEVGQLHPQFCDLVNFTPYPNVARWVEEMAALPEHDTAHQGLAKFAPQFREMHTAMLERYQSKS
eukprot:GGOE01030032.1.p2 GENE.GGOE01030032.1~~GGOE01030032.1.p2  ORF type:complete len:234 (+),score=68.30 GGOE01030032.1:69-704(+)